MSITDPAAVYQAADDEFTDALREQAVAASTLANAERRLSRTRAARYAAWHAYQADEHTKRQEARP